MRHTFMLRSALFAALLAVCTVASAKGPKVPYTHPGMTENDRTHENEVNWVSAADILTGYSPKPGPTRTSSASLTNGRLWIRSPQTRGIALFTNFSRKNVSFTARAHRVSTLNAGVIISLPFSVPPLSNLII